MASTSRNQAWNEVGEWTRLEKLGEGSFGSVFLGYRNSDGKLFVAKSVYFVPKATWTEKAGDKDTAEVDRQRDRQLTTEKYSLSNLINEIRTLRKLKSRYIVRYIGCGTSKGPREMHGRLLLDCYLEYLPRGTIENLLDYGRNSLEEPIVKAYTKDLLLGLQYLHFNKIVHGDLKCSNALIDTDNCKISDFGSVKDVRTSFFQKILIGTSGYRSPEVLAFREQTYKSDIFSLGCTVVEMATGKCNSPERTQAGPRPARQFDLPRYFSAESKDFLSKCVSPDPASRWTASELLKHPFITKASDPGWKPYDIILDPDVESNLLKLKAKGVASFLVPPDDLDSSLPSGPCSPIMQVPPKRQKTGLLGCLPSQDETEVDLPAPPAWRQPVQYQTVAPDTHSAAPRQPAPQPADEVRSPPRRNNPRGATTKKRKQPRESATEAAINRLEEERNRQIKSSTGSVTYQGMDVKFSLVAKLEGQDDEDTDPLVVKICEEFGIPLPPEYQKWIMDPDYDPDSAANKSYDESPKGIFRKLLRAAKEGMNKLRRKP